jgi:hypothetical protein
VADINGNNITSNFGSKFDDQPITDLAPVSMHFDGSLSAISSGVACKTESAESVMNLINDSKSVAVINVKPEILPQTKELTVAANNGQGLVNFATAATTWNSINSSGVCGPGVGGDGRESMNGIILETDANIGAAIPRPLFIIPADMCQAVVDQQTDYSTPEVAELIGDDWLQYNLNSIVSM